MKMRKVFLFCALLAGFAMMIGCQKEQVGVTLKAYISQDSKAYLGSIGSANYPFWSNGDKVRVNGKEYTLSPNSIDQTYATIENVTEANQYFAVFPSSIVRTMDVDGHDLELNLPTTQIYRTITGQDGETYQRLDMPMAARANSNVLVFKNLCSVIRVNVKNMFPVESPRAFDVERIRVTVGDAEISGWIKVDMSDGIVHEEMEPDHDRNTVVLTGERLTPMVNLPNREDEQSFDIVVPPFTNHDVTIRMVTSTGSHYQVKVQSATLELSKMVTITLNVDQLVDNDFAKFGTGEFVNSQLQDVISNFLNNHPGLTLTGINVVEGEVTLPSFYRRVDLGAQLGGDEVDNYVPIYAYIDGTGNYDRTLKIITSATYMYAHENCSTMFAGLTTGFSTTNPGAINFDDHFITDDVTDMSYMFANTNLHVNSIWYFNTEHVTTMAHMFEGNTGIRNNLDLTHFSTASLIPTGMEYMFNGCIHLQYLDLSSFNTSGITSMAGLFMDCKAMDELHLNNFDMSHVTDKTNMCTNLSKGDVDLNILGHTAWNKAKIWCTTDTYDAIDEEGTDFDPNIFLFHDVLE